MFDDDSFVRSGGATVRYPVKLLNFNQIHSLKRFAICTTP